MSQRDIFPFQTFDVTHHFRFGVILLEDFVSEVRAQTLELCGYRSFFRYGTDIMHRFFCRYGKKIQNQRSICLRSSFIDTDTHIAIIKIAQVDFLAQGNGAHFLNGYVVRQLYSQCIKEIFVLQFISQLRELFCQPESHGMHMIGYLLYAVRSVINGIESGHGSQQRLCRTDIGSSLFTLDMLLASLQGHTVTQMTIFVF